MRLGLGSEDWLALLVLTLVNLGANFGGTMLAAYTLAITVPFFSTCGFSDKFCKATAALLDPGLM